MKILAIVAALGWCAAIGMTIQYFQQRAAVEDAAVLIAQSRAIMQQGNIALQKGATALRECIEVVQVLRTKGHDDL